VTNKYGPSGQKPQPVPRGTRRCFICSSPHHLANTCPQRATKGIFSRGNSGAGAVQNPVARPRVNACARSHGKPGRMTQEPIGVTDRTEPQSENNALQPVQKTTEQCESVVNHMKVDEPLKASQDGENEFSLTRNDLLGQKIQDDEYESDVTWSDLPGHKVDDEEPHDPLLTDGWSQLRYVDVAVEGLPDNVTALNHSGCQLCRQI